MTEIEFVVQEAPEGGFIARAVGVDIFTEAADLPGLKAQIRDAVRCHCGADGIVIDDDELMEHAPEGHWLARVRTRQS